MKDSSSILMISGIVVVTSLVSMAVAREFFCWYWKVNEVIALLKRIEEKLGGAPAAPASVQDKSGKGA